MKLPRWGSLSDHEEQRSKPHPNSSGGVEKSYTAECVAFRSKDYPLYWLQQPLQFPNQQSMVSFLGQIEEEGYARWHEGTLVISWNAVYRLMENDHYRSGVSLIDLPPVLPWRPRLESEGGLTDKDFAIVLAGWIDPSGHTVSADLSMVGPVVHWDGADSLLPEKTWHTVQSVTVFYQRKEAARTADSNRRGWAEIRRNALKAGADLSSFLESVIVLTPDKLRLDLRKGEGDAKLIEVIPDFAEAPAGWLDHFDRMSRVLERYDVPTKEGVTQIILSPKVQAVLQEIKQMPGRRVTGARAEAFVRNPFAVLGPDSNTVIDAEEFEKSREIAGISFARFTPDVLRNQDGIITDVTLNIEEPVRGEVRTRQIRFGAPEDLEKFTKHLTERIAQGAQICVWKGEELEILGDTPDHLEALQQALREWKLPQELAFSEIMDLSRYSERIQGFGIEKAYFSPFLARTGHKSQWLPEDVHYGMRFDPGDGTDPVEMHFSEAGLTAFETELGKAKEEGRNTFSVPGTPREIPTGDGQRIVDSINNVRKDVASNSVQVEKLKPVKREQARNQLIVKPNVDSIDYEERRGALSLPVDAVPRLPKTLKAEFPLKPHQLEGLKWLQHLWSLSPTDCRGALLADDMGLGKTIQLLAFIASCLEIDPNIEPFLIVAPVSLLENWKAEIDKFFEPGSMPVLALYGRALAERRQPREALDEQITSAGIDRLLVRNWIGKAKVVLTTYDTLRDLEFSLGRQKWSALICDEAQKIKNPNAMVTRAAKKQNARFRIACTGTPVENTLTDLWCLFDFIQPGLLGALASFGHKYKKPIEAKTETEKMRIDELRDIIEPQKLRRMKTEVAKDLPAKIEPEECRNLAISPYQRGLYIKAMREFRGPTSAPRQTEREEILKLIHYLRSLCTDPRPGGGHSEEDEPVAELEQRSPKLAWLLAELPKIRSRREKVIIFCEFRHLQRTLRRAIGERFGFSPDIINGDTSADAEHANNRQRRIQAFQEAEGFHAIILSPLAVGFGLNIQAANHVIHFTRTWNPAKEDQATDRAYRIGQTRDVYVYYPVVTASDFKTFDARLDELLTWKRGLSHDMLNGAGEVSLDDFGAIDNGNGGNVFVSGVEGTDGATTANSCA